MEDQAEVTQGAIFLLFDKRVGKIEDGLNKLDSQMASQSKTLQQVSDALTAVVRLEERLSASMESSKDQKASLSRVHERLDSNVELLSRTATSIREQFVEIGKAHEASLTCVYERIDAERKDCEERFKPLNNEYNRQQGVLKFVAFTFPIIVSFLMGIGGWFLKGIYEDVKTLQTATAKHDLYEQQIKQLKNDIAISKGARDAER